MQPSLDLINDDILDETSQVSSKVTGDNIPFTIGYHIGDKFQLQAPKGHVLQINKSKFGSRPDGIYSDCTPFIQTLCDGKGYCEADLTESLCGNPDLPSLLEEQVLLTAGEFVKKEPEVTERNVKTPFEPATDTLSQVETKVNETIEKVDEQLKKELNINLETGLGALFIAFMIGFLANKN